MRKFKIVSEESHAFKIGDIVEYVCDDDVFSPEYVAIVAKGLYGESWITQTLFLGTDFPDAVEIFEE